VEPELRGDHVQFGGIRRLSDVPRGHVLRGGAGQPGYQKEDRECHDAHDEQQQYRREQPPDDVSDHSARPVVAGGWVTRRPPVAFTFLRV
jgi:hypothetical protein